jgi:hypothetical protein
MLTFCLFSFYSAKGQSVEPSAMVSAGGHEATVNVSISWSVGEPVIATFTNNNLILTQGFHQPMIASVISSLTNSLNNTIEVYPNPAQDMLFIYSQEYMDKDYRVELYDINGQQYVSKSIFGKNNVLDLKNYSPGTYILRIITSEGYQTFKIVKQ